MVWNNLLSYSIRWLFPKSLGLYPMAW